jgi:hypothetical protein
MNCPKKSVSHPVGSMDLCDQKCFYTSQHMDRGRNSREEEDIQSPDLLNLQH